MRNRIDAGRAAMKETTAGELMEEESRRVGDKKQVRGQTGEARLIN